MMFDFISWYHGLTEYRKRAFLAMFESVGEILLGCGCAEGYLTLEVARKVKAKTFLGIDLNREFLSLAEQKGIHPLRVDLNSGLPLKDETVDVISSDQVIEHLVDVDNFACELYRVLKPGGYAVISTENLASWHNIIAIVLGNQAFSQQISSRWQIGNPHSPNYKKPIDPSVWIQHRTIFTSQGLRDIFEVYGFRVEKFKGIGYFPLPPQLSKCLERIDPIHSYFLAIVLRKPKSNPAR